MAETAHPLRIIALAGGRNIALLAEQARRWRPDYLAVLNSELAQELEAGLPQDYRPIIFWGQNGYATMASLPEVDCVLSAQSGSAGLSATLAAALAGKVIALANKESLVLAGSLLRKLCRAHGASILPVDSEHYALFQCAAGKNGNAIKSLILTASGGPFLHRKAEEIANATIEQTLKHPNWSMGAKISVDSATMMNKGLEYIEAMHLYGMEPGQIRILVHPQSIVHSLVEFQDNSQLAQLAVPDMRLAIGSCLLWPDNQQNFIHPLDLAKHNRLDFMLPDYETFPCLQLAMEAAAFSIPPEWQETGISPACVVLNAANEAAVELFLNGNCAFGEIAQRIRRAMSALLPQPESPMAPSVDLAHSLPGHAVALASILAPLDQKAREAASFQL